MATMQLISKETIKPSCPTPPHLRCFKLSLLDQFTTAMYMPMIYFYPNKGCDSSCNIADNSRRLKNSLSETLSRYYPFAGRLTDDKASIICNDEGVEFLKARVKCKLTEAVKDDETETLNLLFPDGVVWNESYNGSLVVVQLSVFDCGGMAVSVCRTHKITDACSMITFMTDWAAATQQSETFPPEFIAKSILSPTPNDPFMVPEIELGKRNCITKRFVFDGLRISDLKAMAVDSGARNPTRVEVVTALLYKCAMEASTANLGSFRPSILIQLVNMRSRVIPPLPKNSVGNFSWYFTVSTGKQSERKLESLVGQLRSGLMKLCDKAVNNLKVNEWLVTIRESMKEVKVLLDDLDVYRCSSHCRYPFYHVDFVWGKPILVRMASGVVKNTFVLMDAPTGDGIEAWVTLEEQDMAIFQSDEELLAFASLNPIVLA
uniref:Uncharacterized protein n=1 Tax=Davidia involucrata TaxID=16924 RepID=A0A5B7ACY4_DAVIN